ncbi:MAG: hypothetical protein QOJ46_2771 [bacterium]
MLLTCVLATLALGTGTASGSTVSLTIGADPVESVTTQIGAAGSMTAPGGESLYATVKPTGAAGCGANRDADIGDTLISTFAPVGPYTRSVNHTFLTAGSYLLCAWTQTDSTTVTASYTTTAFVRVPKLSLAVAAPAAVQMGQTFQVSATTQAEAARNLYVLALVDTGRGCPANASAASNEASSTIIDGAEVTGGPATDTRNVTLQTPGRYLLCGYLHYQGSATPPQAVSTTVLTVLAPCVVPAVVQNELLAAARARLVASSCTAGAVRYTASSRYARGTVFKFSPVPATVLPTGSAVALYVSTGARCIVPKIPKNRSLASVKRRLKAANCTVGKVSHRRSRTRRRGLVLALSPGVGSRLSPRATVRIVVSSGRPR